MRPMETPINWLVRHIPEYYRQILLTFVIAAGIGVYGLTQLTVDTYSMGFLPEKNPVRADSDKVEEIYGNYLPLEVRLMTGNRNGILSVDFMQRLQQTHDDLEKIPGVEKAASLVDVFKKLNQVWSDGTEATYVVPDSDAKIAQLMMQYESDPDNDLIYMTDSPNYTEARLTVRVPMLSAAVLRDYEAKAQQVLHKNFDATGIIWKFGGYVPLYARIINYVTWSQVSSFALAFVFVFGAIAILFRSFSAMVLVILPNVFPILLTLGVMGLTGIRLDIATVTIAAIALGIVVDDTIHSLYQFYDPVRSNMTPVEAVIDGVKEAGPAMFSTSLIYSLGFLFMVFASIKSILYFGVLLSFTIAVALLSDLVFLPAQICLLRRYLTKDFRSEEEAPASVAADNQDSIVN
jgi:predicted RND superfamily exporter protein